MPIVGTATLRAAGSSGIGTPGDGSYAVGHGGATCSLAESADSAENVVTGQVDDMSALFRGDPMPPMVPAWRCSYSRQNGYNAVSAMPIIFNQDIGAWDAGAATGTDGMFPGPPPSTATAAGTDGLPSKTRYRSQRRRARRSARPAGKIVRSLRPATAFRPTRGEGRRSRRMRRAADPACFPCPDRRH